MEKQFQQILDHSEKILVTSHISPDPDAVSSVLLLGRTLEENYPQKEIQIVLEERPLRDLSFLEDYGQIKFQSLDRALDDFKPDLFIIVDANSFDRVSRKNGESIRAYVSSHHSDLKTAIIDHHEIDGKDETDVFINNKRPATAEEIYALCFDQLKLKKPAGYAETALLGIISDTQRHRFDHPGYRETYRIVSELLDDGASIEKLESRLVHYSKNELDVLSHLAANITDSGHGYTYSFIGDTFFHSWQAAHKSLADLKTGAEEFVDRYIRSFEDNKWGFIVYPEVESGPGWWGVSLRSVSGVKDVSAIARALGGGGHKPAAGAKIQAESAQEAINKVKSAIAGSIAPLTYV